MTTGDSKKGPNYISLHFRSDIQLITGVINEKIETKNIHVQRKYLVYDHGLFSRYKNTIKRVNHSPKRKIEQ